MSYTHLSFSFHNPMKLVLFFPPILQLKTAAMKSATTAGILCSMDNCHPLTAHRQLPVLPPTSSRHPHTHLFLTSTLMRSLHRDTCFCMTIAFPPEPTDTLEEELGGKVCISNLCTHSHTTSHPARPLRSS